MTSWATAPVTTTGNQTATTRNRIGQSLVKPTVRTGRRAAPSGGAVGAGCRGSRDRLGCALFVRGIRQSILPAAADRPIHADQTKGNVALLKGKVVLLLHQELFGHEHRRVIDGSGAILGRGQFHRPLGPRTLVASRAAAGRLAGRRRGPAAAAARSGIAGHLPFSGNPRPRRTAGSVRRGFWACWRLAFCRPGRSLCRRVVLLTTPYQ